MTAYDEAALTYSRALELLEAARSTAALAQMNAEHAARALADLERKPGVPK